MKIESRNNPLIAAFVPDAAAELKVRFSKNTIARVFASPGKKRQSPQLKIAAEIDPFEILLA